VSEPIIRAQAVEKFYLQPDGNRIEVIYPFLASTIALAAVVVTTNRLLWVAILSSRRDALQAGELTFSVSSSQCRSLL
jgi:hypothetical protein